jgi:hypothetical protein
MKKLLLTGILIGALTACSSEPPKAATYPQFKQAASTPSTSQVTTPLDSLTAKLNLPTGLPTLLGQNPINTIRSGVRLMTESRTKSNSPQALLRQLETWISGDTRSTRAANDYRTLERGLYDCTSGTCAAPATNSNYEVLWKTSDVPARTVVLKLVWAKDGVPTASIYNGTSYREAPRKAQMTLEVDGKRFVELNFEANWRTKTSVSPDNIPIPRVVRTPNSLSLSGFLKNETGADLLRLNTFNLAISNTSIVTALDFKSSDGTKTEVTKFNVSVNGIVDFDADGNYFRIIPGGAIPSSFDVTLGKLHFAFKASNWIFGDGMAPISVDIKDGRIEFDQTFVTFDGTLDDPNKNCIPGENLKLYYSDGTKTLEQYLSENTEFSKGCP